LSIYDFASNREKRDLKCFEGPQNRVRPGAKPPYQSPDSAIFKAGTGVVIKSFFRKYFESDRIDDSLIIELFFMRPIRERPGEVSFEAIVCSLV
jgi:hypothetical protein